MAKIRSDELNEYQYVDEVVAFYTEKIIRLFRKLKAKKFKRHEDFIAYLDDFYDDLYILALEAYVDIAKHYYESDKRRMSKAWLKENVLEVYDPVSLYVFDHEVDRKKGRHLEAVIASKNPDKEHDNAMKYWSNMFRQYADTVADKAHLQSLKDDGEQKVMWQSVHDNRRCAECRERDGKIYPISKVPDKPHVGCRCWLVSTNGKNDRADS